MNITELKKACQHQLGIKEDGIDGIITWTAIADRLGVKHDVPASNIIRGDGTWDFVARIDGPDIVVENIIVTCFGGWGGGNINDPQDSGRMASGRNSKQEAINGVSLPLDARMYTNMQQRDPAGFAALAGSPLPRMPWGTLVEITIGGETFTPPDGLQDLGPGKRNTLHRCDVTPIAAKMWAPNTSLAALARDFERTGSMRIKGGAQYVSAQPQGIASPFPAE